MILAHNKIIDAIQRGDIVITPLKDDQIGPASVDLHLDCMFRRFVHHNEVFPVTEDARFEDITEALEIPEGKSLLLKTGETVLGITQERVTLSPNICGWIEGRSRFARIGLGVHITSGFAQPGIDNRQVLEMTNLGPAPLALFPGVRICQLIFQHCDGAGHYNGKFQAQEKP
jgi:dCTP deaminase